jgi:hypothetical protein
VRAGRGGWQPGLEVSDLGAHRAQNGPADNKTLLYHRPKETEMTRSTRIPRAATRVRRVHSQISLANRRMFELTTGVPAARRRRSSRH